MLTMSPLEIIVAFSLAGELRWRPKMLRRRSLNMLRRDEDSALPLRTHQAEPHIECLYLQ